MYFMPSPATDAEKLGLGTHRFFPHMKMLPLIDGAGYKLFDSKMFSLTEGAGDKLFGTKMLPHLLLRRWGSFMEEYMLIAGGYFYHIPQLLWAHYSVIIVATAAQSSQLF